MRRIRKKSDRLAGTACGQLNAYWLDYSQGRMGGKENVGICQPSHLRPTAPEKKGLPPADLAGMDDENSVE
jgi:hypothetical protein